MMYKGGYSRRHLGRTMNAVYCGLDGTAIDDLDVQLLMTIPAAAATTTPPTAAA